MNARTVAHTGLLVALAACGSSTGPGITILKNDSYTTGTLTFAAGFSAGEAAAVRLGPVSTGFTVRKVRFIFGGAAPVDSFNLIISADAGTDNPGSVLYAHVYTVTPSNAAIQEIDVSAQNITVPANQMIRIAFFFKDAGVPSVAPDLDGLTADRNFVYAIGPGWTKAVTAGVTGDWIIRAEVVTN